MEDEFWSQDRGFHSVVPQLNEGQREGFIDELGQAVASGTTGELTTIVGLGADGKGTVQSVEASHATAIASRKPRMTFAKLFASASAPTPLRVIMFGDSLGTAKMQQVLASLSRKFGVPNTAITNTAGNLAGIGSLAGGNNLGIASSSGLSSVTGFQYGFTGVATQIDAGGNAVYNLAGVNPTFSKFRVGYFRSPGAGTFTVSIGGVAQTPVNAAGAFGWQFVEYSQASAQASISISVATGPVVFNLLAVENDAIGGPYRYNLTLGGLSIADAMSDPTSAALITQMLTAIGADLVSFEMDDEIGTEAPRTAAYLSWANAVQAGAPWADKIIIGGTPQSVGTDAVKKTQSAYLNADVASRDASWMFYDGYSAIASEAAITNIFGAYDGKHPPASLQAFEADQMMTGLGLNTFNLGYTPRAICDPGTPSRLARTNYFGTGLNLQFFLDSNEYQGYFRTNFSFGIANASGSNCKFQISYNGSWPSILPDQFNLGSASSTYKFDHTTATGKRVYEWKDTAASGGYALQRAIFVPASITVAQATADAPANSHKAAIVHLTDGSLGNGAYVAFGAFTGDYRRLISFNSTISSPDASDLASAITLLNEIKAKINAALA